MKELDENLLLGWRLRRPSTRLKRKIFGAEKIAPVFTWDFSQLAPATVCVLFALLTLQLGGAGHRHESRREVYADFSGGSNTVVFSDRAQEQENHLASATFDWTNKGVIQSSIGFHSGLWPSTNVSY
jgi:hypothetical protein